MTTDKTLLANAQLTMDEARSGCVKQIMLDGMIAPVDIVIPAGITSGRAITVNSVACVDRMGNSCYKTLYVAVYVPGAKKQKKSIVKRFWAAILALILMGGAITVLRPKETRDTRYYYGHIDSIDSVIPNASQRYYLNTLPESMQSAATLLYQSMVDFKSQCQLPVGIHIDDFCQLLYIMKAECPELFQLDILNDIKYYYDTQSKYVYSVYFQYQISKEIYAEMRVACEQKIAFLFSQTVSMTETEKQKYVFDYLVGSTYYNADGEFASGAYGALVAGEAKCDGISLAMKWCMEQMDIGCLCILANPREGEIGHAWNMIQIGDAYYNVDLTASMRYHDNDDQIIRDVIVYPLYNVSDKWNDGDYVVCDAFDRWTDKPICTTDLNSYYATIDRLYPANSDVATAVFENLTDSMNIGDAISFQLQSSQAYEQLLDEMGAIAENWLNLNLGENGLRVEWAFFANNVVWVRVVVQ